MNRSGTIFLGIVLMVLGIALLLNEYGFGFEINFSWPVFLIFAGGIFLAAYYTARPRKDFLLGGIIMVCLGIYFTMLEDIPALGLHYNSHWPGIIITIGIALFIGGLVDKNSRSLIGVGIIVAGAGLVLLLFSIGGWHRFGPRGVGLLFGVVLLLVGVKVVIDVFIKKKAEA